MYRKILLWTLVFLLSQSVEAQVGQGLDQKKPDITGTWIYNNYGYEVRLILLKDGNGEMAGLPFTYVTNGNVLSISGSLGTTNYKFSLSENTLTLSEGDLETPVSFQRNSNELARTEPKETTENIVQEKEITQGIIGTWQGTGGLISFDEKGIMNYNSVDYRYTAKNGLLTLTGSDGTLNFNYTLSGNTLTLSIGAQSAIYTRTDTKPTQSNTLAQPNSNTAIDASMVGKWCVSSTYTNYQQGGGSSHSECVVLKPDGTYEYSSEGSISGYSQDHSVYGSGNSAGTDKGSWKVQGNTLIATSHITNQTKQYQFYKRNNKNGDPMLVIDGKEFVTFYQKAPW